MSYGDRFVEPCMKKYATTFNAWIVCAALWSNAPGNRVATDNDESRHRWHDNSSWSERVRFVFKGEPLLTTRFYVEQFDFLKLLFVCSFKNDKTTIVRFHSVRKPIMALLKKITIAAFVIDVRIIGNISFACPRDGSRGTSMGGKLFKFQGG